MKVCFDPSHISSDR